MYLVKEVYKDLQCIKAETGWGTAENHPLTFDLTFSPLSENQENLANARFKKAFSLSESYPGINLRFDAIPR